MNTLTELLSNQVAQRIAWSLIHFLWQGTAVALLLAITLYLLRNRSSRERWATSCAAMALMAVLPIATAMVVSVETPERSESPRRSVSADPIPTPLPGDSGEFPTESESGSSLQPGLAHSQKLSEAAPPVGSVFAAQGEQTASASWSARLQDALHPVLPWAVVVWLGGVIVMFVWHFGGWIQVRGLRQGGTRAAGAKVQEMFDRLLTRLRVRRSVRLLESVRVAVPVVVGLLRPVVLLPIGAVTGLSPGQLEAILAHELAHIRRRDCLVQMLQAIMETLLFYHPGVWWVSRQIREESEQCCDDLAVGLCPDRLGYAHALAKVAELGSVQQTAFAAAATGGKLLPRIRRLMKPGEAGSSSHAWPIVALTTVVFASSMLLAIAQAQPASSQRQDSGKDDLRTARIAKLITQLGGEEYADRERAYRELVKIGLPAVAALREATAGKDIERVDRAKTILADIKKRSLRFAIYLVAEPIDLRQAEKTPLDKLQLEDVPLISDDDVVSYDWDRHVLQLTMKAGARFLGGLGNPARSGWHPPFVVTSGNQRLYLGTLWHNHGAVLPRVPMIYFKHGQEARVGFNAIRIEPPSAPGAKDTRGDERVRAGLKQLGRLRKTTADYARADMPWGVAANGLQCRLRMLTPTVAPHRAARLRDHQVYVVYELRNVSDKPIRLLSWSTPLTRMFTTDFRVLGPDGKAAKYMGLCVSPVPPGPGSFLAIGPGQVLSQRAPLTYDFSGPGVYKVSTTKHGDKQELKWFYGKNADGLAKNPDRVWTGTLASNTVTVKVEVLPKPADKKLTTQPSGSKLEFRIVPNGMGSSRRPLIPSFVGRTTQSFAAQALKDLSVKGPCEVAYGDSSLKLRWIEMKHEIPRAGLVVPLVGKYKGKDYVLLCDGDPYVMLPAAGGERRWGLTETEGFHDAQGKTAMRVKFDKSGGELFERLTKANKGNVLAVIVDGKVLSSPVIQTNMSTRAIITGAFTDQQVFNLMRALKAGMGPQKSPTTQPGKTSGVSTPRRAFWPATGGPWETAEAFLAAVANSKDRDAMRMTDPASAVARQIKDFRELPGLKGMSIARMHADDVDALGATKSFELEQKGRKKTVLIQLALIKSRGLWLISDIDLETPESAKAELAEFLRPRPNAIPDVRMVPVHIAPGVVVGTSPDNRKATGKDTTAKGRPLDSVVWDKPRRGWQAGAKLLSTSDQFKVGDSIVIQYLLKNVTTERRTFVLHQIESTRPTLGGDNRISLNISGNSENRHQHTLAPGAVMEKRQYRVAFNTQGMLPGVYTLDSRSVFLEVKKDEPNIATGIGRYIPIRIELSDPARKTFIVYSKPPLAKNPSEKIYWGKRVGGLIVGMRLPKGRTRWTNESRIEAELFIRNVNRQSISLTYQVPPTDEWSMHVQTKDGEDVWLGRVWNTGIRRAVTRSLTIKPGEQVSLTDQRQNRGPTIQVAKAARLQKAGEPARLTTKQGSYTWRAYITVTQKKAPDLTMVVGSGPVPFEIIEPARAELNWLNCLKVAQLESIPKCKATVEKITPCSVHLKTDDGQALSLAGPGGADRAILRFMDTLKKGQTYTLPDAFIEFREKQDKASRVE